MPAPGLSWWKAAAADRLSVRDQSRAEQAVEVVGTVRILHISSQIGIQADDTLPSGMAGQARLAWRNVAAQLAAAGMGFNLVKVRTIIPDATEIPASTLVLAGLADPAWKIEIEGIAYA